MALQFCHGCGSLVPHQHGADLYCSDACRDKYAAQAKEVEAVLKSSGFRQHPETPNLWEKGGVHISAHQVIREGMDQTLAQHSAALEQRAIEQAH